MPSPDPDAARRRQYAVESALARRLRAAPRAERRRLYGEVYAELFRRVPELVLDHAGATRDVELQALALAPFLHSHDLVLLELGAGDCALALHLAGRVRHLYAVEASVSRVAGVRPPGNLEILGPDDVARLPSASVDVAYSCHFLEHLHPEDARDHVLEVRALLKPGGAYLCVTPHRLWGPHDVSRYFGEDEARGLHLREYSYGELAALFRQGGFPRVEALGRLGRAPRRGALAGYRAAETLLEMLPRRLRRPVLMALLGRLWSAPLRPLEQVKVVGFVDPPP